MEENRQAMRIGGERIHQFIEIAINQLRNFVQRQIDAMVGDAALRKIVGTDAFGTIATADQ